MFPSKTEVNSQILAYYSTTINNRFCVFMCCLFYYYGRLTASNVQYLSSHAVVSHPYPTLQPGC